MEKNGNCGTRGKVLEIHFTSVNVKKKKLEKHLYALHYPTLPEYFYFELF